MAGEVLVDDSKNGKDILFAGVVFEELVVDPENGEKELPGEWEVEFGVISDEFSNQGKYIKHA